MALALSMYSIGVFFLAKSDNSSDSWCFNQTNSLNPLLAAIISASPVERAIVFYNRLLQDTAPSENIAIMSAVERLVTVSPAKSASL